MQTRTKPCPICGTTDIAISETYWGRQHVMKMRGIFQYMHKCSECDTTVYGKLVKGKDAAKADAISKWETRYVAEKRTCYNELKNDPFCGSYFQCSECGTESKIEMDFIECGGDNTTVEPNFCPDCGREVI